VNVALPRDVRFGDAVVTTGIQKRAVPGPVSLGTTNLEGDGQADLRHHGGPDKAVYAYTQESISYWERELGGGGLSPGAFGENFTVEGMTDDAVCLGDVYRVGGAVVQATQPRVPCDKLGLAFGDPRFVKRFLRSGRTGFYLRVLEEGVVEAGDDIERIERGAERVSIADLLTLRFFDARNRKAIETVLASRALSQAWRDEFSDLLAGSRR
jgi:MOSC domain-containing protein YiiM